MAPDGTPNAGGRDAEHAARRTSSCAFADNVAAAAMRAYDAVLAHLAHLDPSRPTERGQTVLAAVVARDARCVPPRLRVVSLGAGTKFMRAADIDADALSGTKVRDCHAEVLARRGMKRFLYAQIRAARRRSRDAENVRRGEETRKRHEPPVAVEEEEWLVLEPVPDDAASDAPESWRVRPEVSFHLYASSAPCGNATVKRWARGAKETFDDTLGPFDLPARSGRDPADDEHDKKHNSFGSVAEGQLAFLWKRDPSESRPDGDDDDDARRCPAPVAAPVAGPVAVVPPGTSTRGRVLTCSDKLAVWSCVGVQGALLLARGFLAEPVRFASVTVGRKFNRAVGRRALCCRVRGFARRARFPFAAPPAQSALSGANETDAAPSACTPIRSGTAHHPTLLCTATPFDTGRYAEGEGADFGSADAVVAWLGAGAGAAGESPSERSYVRALAAAAELLNGRTGERVPVPPKGEGVVSKGKGSREAPATERCEAATTVSGVSRAALAAAHAAGEARSGAEGARGPSGTPNAGGSAYAARKAEAGASSGYAEAKREALSQPGLWSLSAPHRHASTTHAPT